MSYTVGVTIPATRTEQVYEMIRSELLNGVLHPGQKLKMVELTERFGVSQSVIREALTRLTEQGLLVATPQRGFRVRDLSIEDIAELTETRVQIDRSRTRKPRCGVATSRPCSVSRVSASRMTDWLTPNRSVSSTIFSFWPGWRTPLSSSDRSTSYTCSVRVAGVATPIA